MNEIQSQAGIDRKVKERIVLAEDSSSNWTSGISSDGKEWNPEIDELKNSKNNWNPKNSKTRKIIKSSYAKK